MTRLRTLLTGLASLALLTGLLAGVPVALVRTVGWPGPTSLPTLDALARSLQLGITDATIVKTLAVIVWAGWAQLAAGVAAELLSLARATTIRIPMVAGAAHTAAARLIAGAVLLASLTAPRTTAAATPLGTLAIQVATPEPALPDTHPAEPSQPTTVPTRTVVTEQRSSWWQLAEDHLDDGLRWRELRQLNLGRTVTAGTTVTHQTETIEPGWSLLVPAQADHPTTRTETDDRLSVWDVGPGDDFWQIAQTTLADQWDRPPTDLETADYWRTLVDDNLDRLAPPHDPDLIHPGETYLLPTPPDDPNAIPTHDVAPSTRPNETPPARDTPPPDPPRADTPPADIDGPDQAGPRADATTDPNVHRPVEQPPTSSGPSRTTPPGTSQATPTSADGATTAWGTPVGLTAGVAASGLLGAGAVTWLRRRRRQQLQLRQAGLRLPTPHPDALAAEARLDAATPTSERLTDLTALLATVPFGTEPVLVTLADDGTVTLLFDDHKPVPTPPTPWTLADDGTDGPVGWAAPIGTHGTPNSMGLPLLVTLGRTDDTTVLANVGAMRHLTVAGTDPDVRATLRRMALEVATSPVAGPVDVIVQGDNHPADVPSLQHTDDLQPQIDDDRAERDADIIPDDRTVRLLVRHDGPLPDLPDDTDALLGLLTISTDAPEGGWQLGLQDTIGTLTLPDGAEVRLTLPQIDFDLLDRHEPHNEPDTDDVDDGHGSGLEPGWCDVQILGPVKVVIDGREVLLPPQQRELLAYLACHPHAAPEKVEDALWAGQPDPTGQRLRAALTKLRTRLGDGPDGQPLVPRRGGPSRSITMSDHVTTDLDRALTLVATPPPAAWTAAERAAEALHLVRGEPFEDLPASWTAEIVHRATARLQQAALDAAETVHAHGDPDRAINLLELGLRLCDPADALYHQWARIEADRGRPDDVRALRRRLAELVEADMDDDNPACPDHSAQTRLATFDELVAPGA